MRKRVFRNFLSFLLVLVLTVCTVAALSLVTQAQTAPDIPAVEEALPAAQLSAAVRPTMEASPLACVGAFLLMLAIVAAGLAVYRREKRRGEGNPQGRRSYAPRADMSFLGKNRV